MPFAVKHQKIGGRKSGTPNKATLLQDERRAIFEQEMSRLFIEKIRAARPEYLLDQFIGKAPTHLDITTLGERIKAEQVDERDERRMEAIGSAGSLLLKLVERTGMTYEQAEERFERWLATKPTLDSPGKFTWEELTGEQP